MLFPMCSEYPDVSPMLQDILITKSKQRLIQSPKCDYFICYSYYQASIDREDCLCRLVRNFFDSSRVSSMLLVNTSRRKANSLSEYEDKSLRILSWKGIKIASIFLSHFLFLTSSIMVRRLSFGSFVLLTYPTFSNLSIIPVTAPVVKPVSSASLPAGMAPYCRIRSKHLWSVM